MKKVFLGGTCNDSSWRAELIELLQIDYFNPVVDDWDEAAQKREIYERCVCDYCLYVITPKMTGVYSIAEAVQDSNKRPDKTLFCYLTKDDDAVFNNRQIKSLDMVVELLKINGVKIFNSLESIAYFLNTIK